MMQSKLGFAVLLMAASLSCFAQQEKPAEPGEQAPIALEQEVEQQGEVADGAENAPADESITPALDPFDYESSEEISEDLSVSFPVDI